MPSLVEVEALVQLFSECPERPGWISVSCPDAAHISDGTPIEEVARVVATAPAGVALGINCTAPRHITGLLEAIEPWLDDRIRVVYPNSGERYDATQGGWTGHGDAGAALARIWFDRGARVIGGCCRTGPAYVTALRDALTPGSRR